jgi:hypothetical protein
MHNGISAEAFVGRTLGEIIGDAAPEYDRREKWKACVAWDYANDH